MGCCSVSVSPPGGGAASQLHPSRPYSPNSRRRRRTGGGGDAQWGVLANTSGPFPTWPNRQTSDTETIWSLAGHCLAVASLAVCATDVAIGAPHEMKIRDTVTRTRWCAGSPRVTVLAGLRTCTEDTVERFGTSSISKRAVPQLPDQCHR